MHTGDINMEILTIAFAFLGGGGVAQLVSSFLGERQTANRDRTNWQRTELFAAFSEMLEFTASTTSNVARDSWAGDIRRVSQRIIILHKNGEPSRDLKHQMERAFQFANSRNGQDLIGEVEKQEFRKIGNDLRVEMAKSLQSL
jgi:hypothetical protein